MDIRFAPSVLDVAGRARDELRAGKVVAFGLPRIASALSWRDEIVDAICTGRDFERPVLIEGVSDSPPTESELARLMDSGAETLAESLQCYAIGTPPAVISIAGSIAESDPWQKLISRILRIYASAADSNSLRPMILVTEGSLPADHCNSPALRRFQLWSPLRWEDMRALAGSWIVDSTNPLIREWRIASYVGAANGDPFLLREICRQAPESLADLHNGHIVPSLRPTGNTRAADFDLPRVDAQWVVPAEYEPHWTSGAVAGASIARGIQVPWSEIHPATAEDYAQHAIWQEQSTSLMPTLIEFTRQAAVWITQHVRADWTQWLKEEGDPFGALEPGRIIFIFGKHKLGTLPDSLFRILEALRGARNKLAHATPLDAQEVAALWARFCDAQQRYRNT